MPDSLYGACLQGFTVVVFIIAKSCAWFDEYIYHDSLQVRAIEGIGYSQFVEAIFVFLGDFHFIYLFINLLINLLIYLFIHYFTSYIHEMDWPTCCKKYC